MSSSGHPSSRDASVAAHTAPGAGPVRSDRYYAIWALIGTVVLFGGSLLMGWWLHV